ncbi:MAG TPA: aminomethyl-transferring glycine dehydrogenase subunit GcvPA [Candidatus Magasanikbacteria bacterium]|nr:aminomethyl-transferring glycine dehydrogenase subunit GcvPA [Candidatus Magasanikbacteria bacterium]
MPYIPHTLQETEEMLKTIGVGKIEDLFSAVPQSVFNKNQFNLPVGLTEQKTKEELTKIANKNKNPQISFLGGGFYNHYIPAHVTHLASRSEFYTAYTPYQPEISQGILQSIFEYQTMITRLTGMSATNASMYDGSTASAETCFMAAEITGKKKILVARSVNPQYRGVMQTYCTAKGLELVEVSFDLTSGKIDQTKLTEMLNDDVAGLFVQSPNFFGVVEDLKDLSAKLHEKKMIVVQIITEALSLGLLTTPKDNGVDIVVGEGQSFGLPVSAGGPGFGFLATTEQYMRRLPGRIVGESEDVDGKKAYVLTLQAREQHIRREKASSNICSNQAWCALTGVIYLASLGQKLRDLALLNHQNALYFQKDLTKKNLNRVFNAPFFNEFVVNVNNLPQVLEILRAKGINAGLDLGRVYSEMENKLLVCVTEMISKENMQTYLDSL